MAEIVDFRHFIIEIPQKRVIYCQLRSIHRHFFPFDSPSISFKEVSLTAWLKCPCFRKLPVQQCQSLECSQYLKLKLSLKKLMPQYALAKLIMLLLYEAYRLFLSAYVRYRTAPYSSSSITPPKGMYAVAQTIRSTGGMIWILTLSS